MNDFSFICQLWKQIDLPIQQKFIFRHQQELEDHLKEHHQLENEKEELPQIQKSCPVCQKVKIVLFFTLTNFSNGFSVFSTNRHILRRILSIFK